MKSENFELSHQIVLVIILVLISVSCYGCDNVTGYSVHQNVSGDVNKYHNNLDYRAYEVDSNQILRDDVFSRISWSDYGLIYETGGQHNLYFLNTLSCSNEDSTPTFSMYPTLKCGDTILNRQIQHINQISIGDLIIFKNPEDDGLTIHRVIQHNGGNVQTKGDNNKFYDPYTVNISMDIRIVVGVFHTGYNGQERDSDDIHRRPNKIIC